MNFKFTIAAAALLAVGASAQAQTVYSQSFDGSGNAYASQNSSGSYAFGNFATVYDDFTLGSSPVFFDTVSWTGVFFNPAEQGAITGFDIAFYNDGGGVPGALDYATHISGDAGQSFLGTDGLGGLDYSYSANVGELEATGFGPFWISIVADMNFPPEWGWATSSEGNNNDYQVFFGSGSTIGANNAFSLSQSQSSSAPGPAAIAPFALGLLGALRRRKSA